MPRIIFTHSYEKRAMKFLKRNPELENQYKKTLQLLEKNPLHPSLRIHRLKGRLSMLHSISINHSYRITLKFIIKNDRVIPVDLGKHEDIY